MFAYAKLAGFRPDVWLGQAGSRTCRFCRTVGRSFIRGIAAASFIAAAVFVTTFIADYFVYFRAYQDGGSTQMLTIILKQATHAFNIPLLVFALAAPMAIVRWRTGHYLSLGAAKPKPPIGVETLLLWTTITACLLYYCRVPMEIHSIGIAARHYLPGLTAFRLRLVPLWPYPQFAGHFYSSGDGGTGRQRLLSR